MSTETFESLIKDSVDSVDSAEALLTAFRESTDIY